MSCDSPFQLREPDVHTIEASDGFRIINSFLIKDSNHSFCRNHSRLPLAAKDKFLLHRTIIHAALVPLLRIHAQAATCAAQLLPNRKSAEFELAFRGDARGAFSWLQCFIAEEGDWCATRGCPACVVLRVLHSEPSIRFVVVACRLSEYLQPSLNNSGPRLPNFGFLVDATAAAVEADDFWGPGLWDDIDARAINLEASVKDLFRQCCVARDVTQAQKRCISASVASCSVKTSQMAERQLSLKKEEQHWMKVFINAVCSATLADAARDRRKASLTRRPSVFPRTRSLTT